MVHRRFTSNAIHLLYYYRQEETLIQYKKKKSAIQLNCYSFTNMTRIVEKKIIESENSNESHVEKTCIDINFIK